MTTYFTFIVLAQRLETRDGWSSSVGVPTFFVRAADELGAERRAVHVLRGATGDDPSVSFSVSVCRFDGDPRDRADVDAVLAWCRGRREVK